MRTTYKILGLLVLFATVSTIMTIPAAAISYGGVWTYIMADGVDFWPGQPLFYEGRLVVPFADATEHYLGLLFFDPNDLKLVDYDVLETSWFPQLFRSFLYKDLAIMVDYNGALVTYNFTNKEWKVFMVLNSSKWLMLFSDAYMDEDGYLYVVGWGGRYYAYSTIVKLKWNGSSFEKIWDAEVNIWNLPGNLLVAGDKVYFATIRGVYAFDKETGKLVAEKKYLVEKPYKPYNMTLWWKDNKVHMLVYLHNNTTFDDDYDALVHLELDPNTLSLIKAGRLYFTNGAPAHPCYFMYTDYPYVVGGEGLGCLDAAWIIDVEKWIMAYFPYRYWLLGSEGTILHTFYASLVRHGDDLYVAVQVSGLPASFDLMVFKVPADLTAVDNDTLFSDLAPIYRLVEKPTTIIQLIPENLGGRNPGYTVVKYVDPKYYNRTELVIEQHHTLNPYRTTTTSSPPPTTSTASTTETSATGTGSTTTTSSAGTSPTSSPGPTSTPPVSTTSPPATSTTGSPPTTASSAAPRGAGQTVYVVVAALVAAAAAVVVGVLWWRRR